MENRESVVKIGVFYDGNYFLHVSNYYNYFHPKRRRISISGLHNFIKHLKMAPRRATFGSIIWRNYRWMRGWI
jgi:hypothetical protein